MATHWNSLLSPPVVLKDGSTIETLLQAGEFLHANYRGVRSPVLQNTIQLLLHAAETGEATDCADAAYQLSRFLAFNRLI